MPHCQGGIRSRSGGVVASSFRLLVPPGFLRRPIPLLEPFRSQRRRECSGLFLGTIFAALVRWRNEMSKQSILKSAAVSLPLALAAWLSAPGLALGQAATTPQSQTAPNRAAPNQQQALQAQLAVPFGIVIQFAVRAGRAANAVLDQIATPLPSGSAAARGRHDWLRRTKPPWWLGLAAAVLGLVTVSALWALWAWRRGGGPRGWWRHRITGQHRLVGECSRLPLGRP